MQKEEGYIRVMWNAVRTLYRSRKQRTLKEESDNDFDFEQLSSSPQDLKRLERALNEYAPLSPAPQPTSPLPPEMLEWLDCLLTWCRDVDDSVVVGRFAVSSV